MSPYLEPDTRVRVINGGSAHHLKLGTVEQTQERQAKVLIDGMDISMWFSHLEIEVLP